MSPVQGMRDTQQAGAQYLSLKKGKGDASAASGRLCCPLLYDPDWCRIIILIANTGALVLKLFGLRIVSHTLKIIKDPRELLFIWLVSVFTVL